MKTYSFPKGVHPPHYKDTENAETVDILPKEGEEFVYPMLQHIGAPCDPLVEVGEKVLVGQKIGDTSAFLATPIHSTVSGVVERIEQTLMPNGLKANAVYVYSDGKMTESPELNKPHDYENMARDEIIEVIKQAGIVGLGGAGFPTHVKLKPPPGKNIDTIIVNAAECEPFLTTDHRVLLEETDKIFLGLTVVLSLFPGAKGIIGVETNKMDGIKKLEEFCEKPEYKGKISVARLHPKYPQGAEKQLIHAITGRQVPSGGLPADIGCVVNNVDTIISVHRAIFRGRPLMRKIVTVTGGAVKKPGNYKIRLGMTYKDMMEAIGGFKTEPAKMISGGPMMGAAMYTLEVPVTKLSSAFLALTAAEAVIPKEKNCIRCARCVDGCPIRLIPFELNQFSLHGERTKFRENHGMDCIECGSCSFSCPSKRHLVQSIRAQRREVLKERSS
ncbi:MAG: electron transport complex subunit RsxC [Defluviitaleaceae bacterium]|nr:electron transport complex subunit RsxC [Defluviitaleaceae bacterium]